MHSFQYFKHELFVYRSIYSFSITCKYNIQTSLNSHVFNQTLSFLTLLSPYLSPKAYIKIRLALITDCAFIAYNEYKIQKGGST